ncbi:toxin-antitoxin system HicB family antitoxin [candidate division KSB1 bacterium]|nr:toxin-antitoxin system HicB family antitoxin [candidate division KSB1 bacterium]
MSTLSLRIPDDLKQKAMQLAKKKNLSFNTFVNHWLQVAVSQDETIEWMKRRLSGKDPELLIAEFGRFLNQTRPGSEPTIDEINEALGDD